MSVLDDRELEKLRRESDIRRSFVDVSFRYFLYGERGPHLTVPLSEVVMDSDPAWVSMILERTEPHDEEFRAFRFFKSPDDTILDIGANQGYSAASLWAAGARTSILAFEPNPSHTGMLVAMRDQKKSPYDFLPVGLGARETVIRFVVPSIDGKAISGLASANLQNTIHWISQVNLVDHAMQYCADNPNPQLRFVECDWRIMRLDKALKIRCLSVPTKSIVGMKIDVEGLEADVLRGAVKTLKKHHPLIMIEGANRNPDVVSVLKPLGYLYADYHDGQCYMNDSMSMVCNGFFVHQSRLSEYFTMGLLASG